MLFSSLSDIFGFDLPNVRLLADEWAEKGYYVLVPDILQGDPIPHDLLVRLDLSAPLVWNLLPFAPPPECDRPELERAEAPEHRHQGVRARPFSFRSPPSSTQTLLPLSILLLFHSANGIKAGAAYGPWAIKHREAVTLPVVTEYLKAVRADSSVGKIATVGFCFGGRYAIIAAGKDSVVK